MRFTLEFPCDNAAFEEDLTGEVHGILLDVAGEIARGERRGKVRDTNGNTVGTWRLA